jgi:hypothetical protein
MSLCQYKDIAGTPGVFPHTHVGGVAILDLIGAIAMAVVASHVFNASLWLCIIIVLLIGVIAHWAFCVDTTFNRVLADVLSPMTGGV